MMFIPTDLNDRSEYPDMVRWFSPIVLAKTVNKVIASTLFGQYADRRLIQAALDKIEGEDALAQRCGDGTSFCAIDGDSTMWVDYVADLGDGFDSTFAIAYLIGQKDIRVEGAEGALPRTQCLIMGGDQVYPDASRDDYEKRMQRPYRFAFPRSLAKDATRPPVFLIPGNHDWYDGLTLFLAKFCRGRPTSLGSWVASQQRSYFAVQLPDNWWIWGYDSQLGEDIDAPQADYFVSVAKQMKPDAKVILCAAVPSWLKAELSDADRAKRDEFYRGLDYIATILRNHVTGGKVPLVLSGDLHHYSRYVADPAGTHFITAGGGGAFLHPTHHLPDSISARWVGLPQMLKLPKDDKTEAVYPPRDASRALAWGNLDFIFRNPEFALTLGGIYWLMTLTLLAWDGYGQAASVAGYLETVGSIAWGMISSPVFLIWTGLFIAALHHYADITPKRRKNIVAAGHALIHLAIAITAAAFLSPALANLRTLPLGDILYFLSFGAGMLVAGLIGGFVWGLYLLFVSFCWGMHSNDAFSAMRLGSYRHFIRMKIKGDDLTLYAVGIDNEPLRSSWKQNPAFKDGDQDTPVFVPKEPLGQRLIERPIRIDAKSVKTLSAVVASTM